MSRGRVLNQLSGRVGVFLSPPFVRRERYRHRDGRRSPSPDRHRKRPRRCVWVDQGGWDRGGGAVAVLTSALLSRSASRDRKRSRWEEERERRSESSSAPSRERSYASARNRDAEEAAPERERGGFPARAREGEAAVTEHDREKEKGEEEREEEELLKPAWIRCTHAESYYSNDPMDQVVPCPADGCSLVPG